MLLVSAVKGTRFKFSAARKSRRTSLLPHSGQRPEKTLNFGGRFLFISRYALTPNDAAQARRVPDARNERETLSRRCLKQPGSALSCVFSCFRSVRMMLDKRVNKSAEIHTAGIT